MALTPVCKCHELPSEAKRVAKRMDERKTVTRSSLAAAVAAVEERDERLGVVGRGSKVDRIFDALRTIE